MLVTPISLNSFNFKGRSAAQNSPAQVKMQGALSSDTVSFGNAQSKAMKNCVNMSKEIFTEFNLIDNLPLEKQAESFLEASKAAMNKIKQNLASMKDANLPTKPDKFADFGGNELHAYKLPFVNAYMFEENTKAVESDVVGELLNSIEIVPEENYVKILHKPLGDKTITREVKGSLSVGADSVEFLRGS